MPKNEKIFDLIIAHRGLHTNEIPENTIGAINNAVLNNVALEIDVQLTKDNVLVVFHDKNLLRLTNVNKNLKDVTYNEIKNLFIKNSKETIPRFEDVLKIIDGKVLLDIEIKYYSKPLKTIKCLGKLLEKYEGKYIIKSFNPFISFLYKLFNKTANVGVLAKKNKIINVLNYLFLYKPDFIAYNIDDINDNIVKKIKKYNIPLYLYTINSSEKLDKAKKWTKTIIYENLDKKRLE